MKQGVFRVADNRPRFGLLHAWIPHPIVGLVLIGAGISVGDLLLVVAHSEGSVVKYWLGIGHMVAGPLAGIALFVYHSRNR